MARAGANNRLSEGDQIMPVVRASARPTKQGARATFTGTVYQDEIVVGIAPSRMRASVVSFTPGARTAWHTHPVGQTLYCLSGVGRICFKGETAAGVEPRRHGDDPAGRACIGTERHRIGCSRISRCPRTAIAARARRGVSTSATRSIRRPWVSLAQVQLRERRSWLLRGSPTAMVVVPPPHRRCAPASPARGEATIQPPLNLPPIPPISLLFVIPPPRASARRRARRMP